MNDPFLAYLRQQRELGFNTVYIDDPPTAAFQIEEGFGRLRSAMEKRTGEGAAFPRMLKSVDGEDFRAFYRDLAAWLYGLK